MLDSTSPVEPTLTHSRNGGRQRQQSGDGPAFCGDHQEWTIRVRLAELMAGNDTTLAARSLATEFAPDLAPLADFVIPRLPRMVLCSDTLHTSHPSSVRMRLSQAINVAYISFNTTDFTNALTFDLDHENVDLVVTEFMRLLHSVDAAAPWPMIVRTSLTGRAHVTWFLKSPVFTGERARDKPIQLLTAVRIGLTEALQADPTFTNRLTKNPFAINNWSNVWCVNRGGGYPIELNALRRALTQYEHETGRKIRLPRLSFRNSHSMLVPPRDQERGKRLFDAARFVIYALGTSDVKIIREIVEQQAAAIGSPATPRQQTTIARSIAQYMGACSRRGRPQRKGHPRPNRGILRLDETNLSRPERQRLGALHTASKRRTATEATLATSLLALLAAGTIITQPILAEAANVKLRQVQRLWKTDVVPFQSINSATMRKAALRCLSGNESFGAHKLSSQNQELMSVSPAVLAQLSRVKAREQKHQQAAEAKIVRHEVAVLRGFADRCQKRGSKPAPLPAVSMTSHTAVAEALVTAKLAFQDAKRRKKARMNSKLSQLRRVIRLEELASLAITATSRSDAWRAFNSRKEGIEEEIRISEKRSVADGWSNPTYWRRLRSSIFSAEYRAWQQILTRIWPPPVRSFPLLDRIRES